MQTDIKFIIKHISGKRDLPRVVLDKILVILKSRHKEKESGEEKVCLKMYLNKNIGRFGNINILLFSPKYKVFFVINLRFPRTKLRLNHYPYHVNVRKQIRRLSNFLSAISSQEKETGNNKPKNILHVDIYGLTWCQLKEEDRVLPSIFSVKGLAVNRNKFSFCTNRNLNNIMFFTI